MKKTTALLTLLMLQSSFAVADAVRQSDFALLDQNGKFHQLSYFGDQKAVVIAVQANGDKLVRTHAPALNLLQDQFADQGAVFFMLNATDSDRKSVAEEAQAHAYGMPVLMDEAQLVAETFDLGRVGEVLIVDPARFTVIHRGALEDSSALGDALSAIVSGTEVAQTGSLSSGAPLIFAGLAKDEAAPVSYAKDIAPILEENCVQCHHQGGIGPWSMSDHAMIRGWSAMIREVVLTRRMPPGQIDPHVGKDIEDAAGLSLREMQQLVHWIDAGAPSDLQSPGDSDPLTALTFNDSKYTLGEPDLTFKVSAQTIPATGIIDYRYVPVELNLDRDVWIRAMEFVPGDRQVLHHVIAYVSSPADKSVRGRETGAARGESLGGFAPGRQPDQFRDNSGRLLTKGSNLLLQMHYTTSGRETVDVTEVGLYLHDTPPDYVMSGGVAGQRRFLVPPYAKEYKIVGEQKIERDAYLYELTPHMHFRGKYMSYVAEYPDGTSEVLLSVPKYDFNWQFNYPLAQPLFLPAGSRILAKGAMDNSDRNPGNPDPSKPVHFGLQTKHEMFFGFTTLRYVGDTPQSVSQNSLTPETANTRQGTTGGQ